MIVSLEIKWGNKPKTTSRWFLVISFLIPESRIQILARPYRIGLRYDSGGNPPLGHLHVNVDTGGK